MIYLVHVGCHLITTCPPRHWLNGHGHDRRMNIGGHGRYRHISTDEREHVGREHIGREHVRCEHVGHEHISGANLRAPT
jgi:hypothetical protein